MKDNSKEQGKVLLREDLQKALLTAKHVVNCRKLTHWARG